MISLEQQHAQSKCILRSLSQSWESLVADLWCRTWPVRPKEKSPERVFLYYKVWHCEPGLLPYYPSATGLRKIKCLEKWQPLTVRSYKPEVKSLLAESWEKQKDKKDLNLWWNCWIHKSTWWPHLSPYFLIRKCKFYISYSQTWLLSLAAQTVPIDKHSLGQWDWEGVLLISCEIECSAHTSRGRKRGGLVRAGTKGVNLTRLSLLFRSWQT